MIMQNSWPTNWFPEQPTVLSWTGLLTYSMEILSQSIPVSVLLNLKTGWGS